MSKKKDDTSVLRAGCLLLMEEGTRGCTVFFTLTCVCLKFKMFSKPSGSL